MRSTTSCLSSNRAIEVAADATRATCPDCGLDVKVNRSATRGATLTRHEPRRTTRSFPGPYARRFGVPPTNDELRVAATALRRGAAVGEVAARLGIDAATLRRDLERRRRTRSRGGRPRFPDPPAIEEAGT